MTKDRDSRSYAEAPRSEGNPDLKDIGERKDRKASVEQTIRDHDGATGGLAGKLPK